MARRPTASDLGRLPLFGGLPEDALKAFAEKADIQEIDAGAVVFREGESARNLFVLESGALDVVRDRPEGNVTLWKIRPGESFGEMSFIDMQPRSATVRALERTTLWAWPYSAIHERYCSDSKCYTLFVMNIARELSRRLRRADEMLVSGS